MVTRDTNIKLEMYNQTTVTQLSICQEKIKQNKKQKMCNFFVIQGNSQELLGMPDIEILNILTKSCNTIGTEEADKDANCSKTHKLPVMQEVCSTMQVHSQKVASQKGAI